MNLITYERQLSGDTETPISLFSKYVGTQQGFLLESKELPRGRYSFMAANPYMVVQVLKDQVTTTIGTKTKHYTGNPLSIIETLMSHIQVDNRTTLPFIGGAVGTVGYDMIRNNEKLPDNNEDTLGTPDAHLLFVKELLAYDHHFHQIHLVCLDEATEEGRKRSEKRLDALELMIHAPLTLQRDFQPLDIDFHSNMTQEVFVEAVTKAKTYIVEGDIFQVVLSQRFSGQGENIDAFNLYRKLRQINPSPYMYYFHMGDYFIVGSSPEMLVELKEDIVATCPIAGTRKIGLTEEKNKLAEADLLTDEKERAEHMMLVDLGRNDMGKIAVIDSVTIEKLMEVHHYSHVMHLVSLILGKRRPELSMFDILMSFLPAGTLSGAPKIRAMEIIDELENKRRGIYGGAIGYFGFNGNMDMCIAIRTMVIKEDTIHIQAGAGIVADSDPFSEYEETIHKAKALITAITK